MEILILGGNRFVGRKLAEKLSQYYNVTIFNRSGTGPDGCNIVKGDRNVSFKGLRDNYDIVIDFCLFKKDQALKTVSWFKANQRYVFISSGSVYKDNPKLLYDENMEIGGMKSFGNYGIEKSECELIITENIDSYAILRPPYIIGTNSPRPRIEYYIKQIKEGLPVEVAGKGDKVLSFVWIDDLINVIESCIERHWCQRTYNVVGEDFYTSKSLIEEVANYLKLPYTILENGQNSPFIDEHLMLSPLKLNRKFTPLKDRLHEFSI